jgi:hypothetical protein
MTYLEKVMKALYLFFGICVLVGTIQLFIFWFGLGMLWSGDMIFAVAISLVGTVISIALFWLALRIGETLMGIIIDEE